MHAGALLIHRWPTVGRPCCTSKRDVGDLRALVRATVRESHASSTPLSIVANDLQFLQEHTGLDLADTIRPVRDVHDQVAAVLNPLVKEKLTEELQEEIQHLQTGLDKAHEEVHALEDQLSDTIRYLSGLERTSDSLQEALHVSPSVGRLNEPDARQQNERQQSSAAASTSSDVRKRGALHSDLEIPDTLREFWYPVEFSSKLGPGQFRPFDLFNEPWQVTRDQEGSLSCLFRPSQQRQQNERPDSVRAPQLAEQDGFVYVWTGQQPPRSQPDSITLPPPDFTIHSELELEVPVEHGLLLENLLDLAHAPFTHTSTFAKGWPIPDVVKFNAARMLGGNWEPYPIDMSFEPPCMVLSTIGLAQPGKIERGLRAAACKKHLHQLHVCLPAGTGRTRLLYRMSMDFLAWTKLVPFIGKFWASIANQVLGEDLVLVKGQQARMLAGASVWANPVSYDKLGVRYRRWRNTLSSGTEAEQKAAKDELVSMAAGEIFRIED